MSEYPQNNNYLAADLLDRLCMPNAKGQILGEVEELTEGKTNDAVYPFKKVVENLTEIKKFKTQILGDWHQKCGELTVKNNAMLQKGTQLKQLDPIVFLKELLAIADTMQNRAARNFLRKMAHSLGGFKYHLSKKMRASQVDAVNVSKVAETQNVTPFQIPQTTEPVQPTPNSTPKGEENVEQQATTNPLEGVQNIVFAPVLENDSTRELYKFADIFHQIALVFFRFARKADQEIHDCLTKKGALEADIKQLDERIAQKKAEMDNLEAHGQNLQLEISSLLELQLPVFQPIFDAADDLLQFEMNIEEILHEIDNKMNELEEIHEARMNQELYCCNCQKFKKAVLFHPCQHMCVCQMCDQGLKFCPQCNTLIESRTTINISQ